MIFFHAIPEGEEMAHIPDRSCECIPYIDPSDISTFVHNEIGVPDVFF